MIDIRELQHRIIKLEKQRDFLIEGLRFARDALYNGFEPDNQSKALA